MLANCLCGHIIRCDSITEAPNKLMKQPLLIFSEANMETEAEREGMSHLFGVATACVGDS